MKIMIIDPYKIEYTATYAPTSWLPNGAISKRITDQKAIRNADAGSCDAVVLFAGPEQDPAAVSKFCQEAGIPEAKCIVCGPKAMNFGDAFAAEYILGHATQQSVVNVKLKDALKRLFGC